MFKYYSRSMNKTDKLYLSRDRRLNKIRTHTHVFTCCHFYTENFSWKNGFLNTHEACSVRVKHRRFKKFTPHLSLRKYRSMHVLIWETHATEKGTANAKAVRRLVPFLLEAQREATCDQRDRVQEGEAGFKAKTRSGKNRASSTL